MCFFTVVIAAYNAEGFIKEAISSVQIQDFQDWEIVVVDDYSSDTSRNVVKSLAQNDKRIRLICLDRNGGPSVARNRAIDSAKGEWIVVLDADDALLPGRLSRINALALQGCDIVADNLVFKDDATKKIVGSAFRKRTGVWPLSALDVIKSERSWPGFRMGYLKPAFRRSLLEQNLIRYDPEIRHGEDFLFLIRLLVASKKAVSIGVPGYVYTQQISESTARRSMTTRSRHNMHDRILAGKVLQDIVEGYGSRQVYKAAQRYNNRLADLAKTAQAIQHVKQRRKGSYIALARIGLKPIIRFTLVNPRVKRFLKKIRLAHSIAS